MEDKNNLQKLNQLRKTSQEILKNNLSMSINGEVFEGVGEVTFDPGKVSIAGNEQKGFKIPKDLSFTIEVDIDPNFNFQDMYYDSVRNERIENCKRCHRNGKCFIQTIWEIDPEECKLSPSEQEDYIQDLPNGQTLHGEINKERWDNGRNE